MQQKSQNKVHQKELNDDPLYLKLRTKKLYWVGARAGNSMTLQASAEVVDKGLYYELIIQIARI